MSQYIGINYQGFVLPGSVENQQGDRHRRRYNNNNCSQHEIRPWECSEFVAESRANLRPSGVLFVRCIVDIRTALTS